MSFRELPDLGKIGKRIGKRLRDVLNPPVDHGPSKEERLAQRLRDSLKGLVYFDNFDEIDEWNVRNVDPGQQANTPLLERSAQHVYGRIGPTSRVLLCHDYSGGYHAWEGLRPLVIENKHYSCKYLQYVETFVYFSHKLVCVPPACWMNLCHRNGVKVLGTFILEGNGKSIERMFSQINGEFVVAKRLANMAKAYGFDGWLLNIEAEFPLIVQHPISDLTAFIRNLKRHLGPHGAVVWYDAITNDNEVDYQNALTSKNVEFALASDTLFTNYRWTEYELSETKAVAQQHGIKYAEVYFGIDVWAQNTNMPGPPRITYPPEGGGGTLTGLAVDLLAVHGFSTAIFAPGWAYEHFPRSTKASKPEMESASLWCEVFTEKSTLLESEAEVVDRAMWEGSPLPDELDCNCKRGHPHQRKEYKDNPILKGACEYPAGSSSFLETNFRQAFTPVLDFGNEPPAIGKPSWLPTLGSQSVTPHQLPRSLESASEIALYSELQNSWVTCLKIGLHSLSELPAPDVRIRHPRAMMSRLCLYKTLFSTSFSLEATVSFGICNLNEDSLLGFYSASDSLDSQGLDYVEYVIHNDRNLSPRKISFALKTRTPDARIVEFGVYYRSPSDRDQHLLNLYSLVIKPAGHSRHDWTITRIEIIHRQAGSESEKRLAWKWGGGSKEQWLPEVPWSDTTGPFSVFTIWIAGRELGEAHCLEFPIRPEDKHDQAEGGRLAEAETDHVDVMIQGRLFGGGTVSSGKVPLPRARLFGGL